MPCGKRCPSPLAAPSQCARREQPPAPPAPPPPVAGLCRNPAPACSGLPRPRPRTAGLRVAVSCSLRTAPASRSCPWLGRSRGAVSETAGACDPHRRFAHPVCPQALAAPVPTTVLWKHFSGTVSCNRPAMNIAFSR